MMLGERMKRFRLARGMSLDDVVHAMDGIVSKQALSKYERGLMRPSHRVMNRIASVYGVKAMQIWEAPQIQVEVVHFR